MNSNESLSVRKIPFYLFLIALGFLINFVLNKMSNKDESKTEYTVATKAGPIPEKTAKEYLHNYLSSQDSLGASSKLVTSQGETLRGFWISKQMLRSIDSTIKASDKRANVVGYSIYFGKETSYSKDKKQAINLVVRGTIPVAKETASTNKNMMKLGSSPIDFEDAGDYYDMVESCPSRCGSPDPGN